jgi:hypothetical protein
MRRHAKESRPVFFAKGRSMPALNSLFFCDDFELIGAVLRQRSIVRPFSLCWSFVALPQLYRRMPNLKISIRCANRSGRRYRISSSGAQAFSLDFEAGVPCHQ